MGSGVKCTPCRLRPTHVEFLAGRDEEPVFDSKTVDDISALARKRWLVPRGERRPSYQQFRREHLCDVLTPETMET